MKSYGAVVRTVRIHSKVSSPLGSSYCRCAMRSMASCICRSGRSRSMNFATRLEYQLMDFGTQFPLSARRERIHPVVGRLRNVYENAHPYLTTQAHYCQPSHNFECAMAPHGLAGLGSLYENSSLFVPAIRPSTMIVEAR